MSIWQSIKDTYKRVDEKLGGYMPGGVSPSSVSGSGTSSSTTTTATQTKIPQKNVGSVVVTDYRSGESVTTKINDQGKVASQTYSSSPKKSSSQIGEQKAVQYANEPGGLVDFEKVRSQPSSGNSLQPAEGSGSAASISAYNYTGEPPERYGAPIGSALKQSFANVLNFGVIGQQGLVAYVKQAVYEPFEYVGKPKAYDELGYTGNSQLDYVEAGYHQLTYFEYGEQIKSQTFSKAGLIYSGQSASILPNLIAEDVVKDITPKYKEQIGKKNLELFNYYQNKVNTGELTLEQAQSQFNFASGEYAAGVNASYQKDIQESFNKRYSGVASGISQINLYESKIFEPPAYPIIRTTGKVLETGALIGATAFGGSGLTLAASAYIGAKTASSTVSYIGAYNSMTTSQKILGGSSIAIGAAATGYTFNLGVSRFYGEWRGIIYQDLAQTPARVTGAEVFKNEELTRYNVAALRQSGVNSVKTAQVVDVYPTGEDSIGFFSKGKTMTTVFDPESSMMVKTIEPFKMSGNIPNIKSGFLRVGDSSQRIIIEDMYSGVGNAIYSSKNSIRSFQFIAASKDQGQFYAVIGGAKPAPVLDYTSPEGARFVSTTVRGTHDSTGRIFKLQETEIIHISTTSGRRSSQDFLSQLYSTGGGAGNELAAGAQRFAIQDLAVKSFQDQSSGVISVQALNAASSSRKFYAVGSLEDSSSKMESKVISYELPKLQDLGLKESQGVFSPGAIVSAVAWFNSERQSVTPFQSQAPALAEIASPKLRTGFITPASPGMSQFFSDPDIPYSPRIIPPFRFDLDPGGLYLPSNILKGGTKYVSYTPSFQALLFNIRGSQPKGQETGINFRPITPGFRFNTGLNFPKHFNLRRLFRR